MCRALILFLGFASMFTANAVIATDAPHKWTMGYVPTPVFFTDQTSSLTGSLAPLNQCFLERFGDVDLVRMPNFERLAKSLNDNSINVGLNISRSPQRDKIAHYAGHQFSYDIVKLVRTDIAQPKVLGVKRGDADSMHFVANHRQFTFVYVKGTEQLIGLFNLERIDGFIEAGPILSSALRSTAIDISYVTEKVDDAYAGIYVSQPAKERFYSGISDIQRVLSRCSALLPETATGFNSIVTAPLSTEVDS